MPRSCHSRPAFTLVLALGLAVAALCAAASAQAEGRSDALRQSIRQESKRAEQGRRTVDSLTSKERRLNADLAKIEADLATLRKRIAKREDSLAALDDKRKNLLHRQEDVEAEKARTRRQLSRLVNALWPLRVRAKQGRSASDPAWAATDRRFAWGAALYSRVQSALRELDKQDQKLQKLATQHRALRAEAEERIDAINADKDDLVQRRISFVQRLRKVRTRRISEEQALSQILSVIDDMNYRLKALSETGIKRRKGTLHMPVSGKRFTPRQGSGSRLTMAPGRRGISFHTVDGASVNAVFAGRVVHSDILRGYGRVVILSHGDKYYSLYAFLSESNVIRGDTVKEGQTIGWTGPYPAADGPGLYFELRFGQKAINPDEWLTALR